MKKRIITAIIGIPLTIGIWAISHIWQELPMLLLVLLAGLTINYEIFIMTRDQRDYRYPFFRIGTMMTISLLFSYLYGMKLIDLTTFLTTHFMLTMIFFYWIVGQVLFCSNSINQKVEYIGFYILIYITLVLLLPQVFLVKVIYTNIWGIVLLFTFCWLSDAYAFFIGSAFGKHKLPNIPSSAKTIEGYIGSLILTLLTGTIFYYIQGMLHIPFQWSLLKWLLFSLCINLSSGFGDLLESLIKRWCQKKDSGGILPGMGGLFDTIDSQIYSIPIILFFYNF